MKKIVCSFLCFLILIIINTFVSKIFKVGFLEMSFLTGLISSSVIWFFSSEGGFTSNAMDMKIKHLLESQSRTQSYFTKFHISIPFIVCVVYTIIAGIFSIIAYWKYF